MNAENTIKTEVYGFNDCVLDVDRRELSRADDVVTLQPKAFELLLFLVRNRHRAVDKDEIQDVLWPRSIVTETALTRCVMKARRAVGDDAERQSVIRTVHGHGYRFVAQLDDDRPEPAAEPALEPVAEPATGTATGVRPPLRTPRRPWLIAAAAAFVATGFAWWLLGPTAIGSETRLAVLPVANATGDDDLGWVRTGMMSLMNRMLESRGVQVVGEKDILDLAGEQPLTMLTRADSPFVQALADTIAPTHTLAASLDRDDDLYRLSVVLAGGAREQRRTFVGREPAELAQQAAETVANLVHIGTPPDDHVHDVSDDPFLNEAYARAMSLQFEGDYEEAKRFFEVIIEQDPSLFWPRYEYALCVRNLRDWEMAERLLTAIVEEVTAAGRTDLQAITNNGLGILYMQQRRNEEAVQAFERVETFALQADKPMYVVTANVNLAIVTRNMGDVDRAAAHLEKAWGLLQKMDLRSYPGTFHNTYAGILLRLGKLTDAETHALKAIENFQLTGKRLFAAYAQSRLSVIYRAAGRYDEAFELAERSLAVRREFNDPSGVASSLMSLSEISVDRGDITRARIYAEQVLDIGVSTDDADARAMAHAQIAETDRIAGELQRALDHYREARALYMTLDDPLAVAGVDAGIARTMLELGRHAEAEALARALLESARDAGSDRDEARALILLGEIERARGRAAEAAGLLEQSLEIARRNGDEALGYAVHLSLANALLDADGFDRASEHVEYVVLARPTSADTLRLLARVAWARNDPAASLEAMTEARNRAGETWRAEDEADLERYRAAASGD